MDRGKENILSDSRLHGSRPYLDRTTQQTESTGACMLELLPTETVPVTSSSAVHSTTEPNSLATTASLDLQAASNQTSNTLEVEYPLTIKERIRRLQSSTTLKLVVDPSGRFTPENAAKLRQVKAFLSLNTSRLYKKVFFPEVKLSLVALADDSGQCETLICVEGLATDADIAKFHLVMSQREVRQHYTPLRVCYQRGLLPRNDPRPWSMFRRWNNTTPQFQIKAPASEWDRSAAQRYLLQDADLGCTWLSDQYHDTPKSSLSRRVLFGLSWSKRRALDPEAYPPIVID